MIRILIADDHDILRAGLKHILSDSPDIIVGGEASDGAEAMVALRSGEWDAAVLDLNMPGRNGLELIKQVKDEFPRLPILILSMYKEDIYAVRALKAGASGYLCKDNAESLLAEAIRKIVGGGLFIKQSVAENLTRDILQGRHTQLPHNRLTDRNYQIFLMLVQGLGVSEIARRLNLSVKTVSTHKANIQAKMGLGNTAELVRYAVQHHLITDAPLPG
ncbi:response regulator [Thauera linaloolentis]|uniref:LuxR family transcriptional regulator n=1 Tax=Thauera linaloolentis (strain DSM 12138 / JCM 21573 / CCUG 41526 / CIP 105981 / IAM 15112 / NBRC 102519 / 47Lol) TaxID=1123367 RepID=N6Z5D5_THAL4|nr:response regulator transcription factor [Thauera linaloolentis]ENO89638.1 LuxR family transcriptional regulator [Thauera linaloolentis 47Lol = DSM 12138]MCM8567118.1 response regulator transcription factor [Thauera linaloolentis]